MQKIGIVVPTLGIRPEYLQECLVSIREAGQRAGGVFVILVAPVAFDSVSLFDSNLIDAVVHDPRRGLANAINVGFQAMPKNIEFVNWLGDDDLISVDSLKETLNILNEDPDVVMVFGRCTYIDSIGEELFTLPTGQWAVPLLRFGPDLIPQPGSLFRKDAFNKVHGLDERYNWAFDFDLFLKLSKIGKVKFLPKVLSYFRWHPDSLSVDFRKKSVLEASNVRIAHLPRRLRKIAMMWERPVRLATFRAGKSVSRIAKGK